MEIHEIVKAIRLEIGLSQKRFAKEILVNFATVNRWENNRSKPNQIAHHALVELAKKHNVNTKLIQALKDAK